jgi:hypothetical protein
VTVRLPELRWIIEGDLPNRPGDSRDAFQRSSGSRSGPGGDDDEGDEGEG